MILNIRFPMKILLFSDVEIEKKNISLQVLTLLNKSI